MFSDILAIAKTAFGLAKSSPMKLVLILAIISACTGFFVWWHGTIHDGGYNKCIVDQKKAGDKITVVKTDNLQKKYDELKEKQKETQKQFKKMEIELGKLRKTRINLQYEISQYKNAACTNLGDEFLRLFNGSIGTEPGGFGP